ncbi:MAG TPA: hypothetical protein DEF12_15155 [Rhodobacteraceae bacterium]|jgi:DNA-binding MarR family transcriptional regulator|nr:hypothetical protein [Paracoccaceae bacterium]HBV56356.1 hypothetical protein [Paracoccaceae bacterium]
MPEIRHPPIETIEDALTFKIARFAAINAADGAVIFSKALGLTLNEWRVLGLVGAHQPVTLAQIAARLLMDKGQLSRLLRGLLARGLLTSETRLADARQSDLCLSAEGVMLHQRGLAIVQDRNDEVVAPFNPIELDQFMALLDRLMLYNEELVAKAGNL